MSSGNPLTASCCPSGVERNRLNLSLFALILKLLRHELKIRRLIWRHRRGGRRIIGAQGCIHFVWSHPWRSTWRSQTWPDCEAPGLCWGVASVLCGVTTCRLLCQGRIVFALFFYGFPWMSLNVVGWMAVVDHWGVDERSRGWSESVR